MQVQTMMREYKNKDQMQRDARSMASQGWRIATTMQMQRRRGCLARLMWLPWLASKAPHYMVTYER